MQYFGFVYLWFDRRNRRFYLGSHMGLVDDGYVCSSRYMRAEYNKRPQDFKRRILYRIPVNDPKALLLIEARWISMIKESELGSRYYNHTTSVVCLSGHGFKRSEEFRRLLRTANKGKRPSQAALDAVIRANTGRVKTPEETRKRSESLRGEKNPFFGRTHSEESKAQISKAAKGNKRWLGKRHSEETKRKMSKSAGGNQRRVGKLQTQATKDKISAAKRGISIHRKHRAMRDLFD